MHRSTPSFTQQADGRSRGSPERCVLRWKGGKPEETDLVSFRNLLGALPQGLKRVIFTSSAGVERQGSFPYVILNLFGTPPATEQWSIRASCTSSKQADCMLKPVGHAELVLKCNSRCRLHRAPGVLKYKRQAEQLLEASGLPFVLLRPGRLTDGPYTSYDLNTLLQATAGSRQDVQLSAAETQNGEASRIAVAGLLWPPCHLALRPFPTLPTSAWLSHPHPSSNPINYITSADCFAEAMVQLLSAKDVEGRKFSLVSTEGDGPGQDTAAWQQLFTSAYS